MISRHNSTRNITNGFEISHVQEPIVEERNSLDALKIFIAHACEILGLWKILCENQLHNIVSCLSKVTFSLIYFNFQINYSVKMIDIHFEKWLQEQINQFATATFRDLILIGQEISSLLIIHLIDR